jgi:glycine cleavage system aminomethyltransferase T
MDKPGGVIGPSREALLAQKHAGLKQRLVQFLLKDPQPMLYHNEPIWQGDRIAGYIRSGSSRTASAEPAGLAM